MKQLENTISLEGGHVATLVKRNDKAAMYERKDEHGHFVQWEVFAIMTKDGSEVYPNQTAVKKQWCYVPVSRDRADLWFERFTNGDVTIPEVDPVTGDPLEKADNRSIDELPDMNVDIPAPVGSHDNPVILPTVDLTDIVSVPSEVPTVEAPTAPAEISMEEDPTAPVEGSVDVPANEPTVEAPTAPAEISMEEDPTAPVEVSVDVPANEPTVEVPEVEVPADEPTVASTPDGGAVVTVARVRKNKVTMVIPAGEFTQADIANANGMPVRGAIWGRIQNEIKEGRVRLVEMRKITKGRPTAIYTGIPTAVVPAVVAPAA